jgi:hypothetical protein
MRLCRGGSRRLSAAKLAVNPAGGSPACADCPVGTVAISSVEAGDRLGGSLEVKVLGGKAKAESDLSGGRTNRQVVAQANRS